MPLHDLTLQECLNLPISFLLQENSIEDLQQKRDYNSFALSHLAVANNNLSKVNELIANKFDFSICTSNGYISDEILKISNLNLDNQYYSIPFNKNGYCAVHLCILLHSLHYNLVINEYQNSKHDQFKEQQMQILKLFLHDEPFIFELQDNNGYTVLDYCFIFENMDLIELAFNADCCFNSLNNIKTSTAINILQSLKIKYSKMNKVINPQIDDRILTSLEKKLQYENLDNKVPQKDNRKLTRKI